mmetsp:Transcript_22509/g.75969  ORF Transcript_22509/g.75969 Transcript_22509/m.75969 type:complete len:379 (-) Transcript_22509:681-1817(-)
MGCGRIVALAANGGPSTRTGGCAAGATTDGASFESDASSTWAASACRATTASAASASFSTASASASSAASASASSSASHPPRLAAAVYWESPSTARASLDKFDGEGVGREAKEAARLRPAAGSRRQAPLLPWRAQAAHVVEEERVRRGEGDEAARAGAETASVPARGRRRRHGTEAVELPPRRPGLLEVEQQRRAFGGAGAQVGAVQRGPSRDEQRPRVFAELGAAPAKRRVRRGPPARQLGLPRQPRRQARLPPACGSARRRRRQRRGGGWQPLEPQHTEVPSLEKGNRLAGQARVEDSVQHSTPERAHRCARERGVARAAAAAAAGRLHAHEMEPVVAPRKAEAGAGAERRDRHLPYLPAGGQAEAAEAAAAAQPI